MSTEKLTKQGVRELDSLARDMMSEAEQWDADALHVRREYGIDRPEKVTSKEQEPRVVNEISSRAQEAISGLRFQDVGPAPALRIPIAPRLSLFIGDNGTGKTFAIDVLFWMLTGRWWRGLPASRTGPLPASLDGGGFEEESVIRVQRANEPAELPIMH